MSIQFDAESRTFHLTAAETSYILRIIDGGYLAHLYWGKRLRRYDGSNALQYLDRGFSLTPTRMTARSPLTHFRRNIRLTEALISAIRPIKFRAWMVQPSPICG